MTSGAKIIELMGQPKGVPVRFFVQDTVAIEKGDLLWLSGAKYVSGASTTLGAFAGIANQEKVAGDGAKSIGCWTCGLFDIVGGGGAIATGNLVKISGANKIAILDDAGDLSGGRMVGKCLEDGATDETVLIAVGVY